MPAPHTDRRPAVLALAQQHGWDHDEAVFDEDQIVRDVFVKGDRELRLVWLRTPYSEAMWARGLLTRPRRAPVTVPRVTGQSPMVEGILAGTDPAAA